MRQVIHATTGTFGVRATPVERWPAARTFDEVTVEGMVVRMKISGGRAKPEFDDVAALPSTGTPLRDSLDYRN